MWGWVKKVKKAVKKAAKAVKDCIVETAEAAYQWLWCLIKDFFHIFKHVGKGLYLLSTGDKEGAKEEFDKAKHHAWEFFSDAAWGWLNVIIIASINFLSLFQRLAGLEDEGRPLLPEEERLLKAIFHNKIEYPRVRIVEGDMGILGITDSVFVMGRRIRVSTGSGFVPVISYPSVLVHEATHVWQFEQGGPDYVSDSLWAMATGGDGDGYRISHHTGDEIQAPRGYAFDVAVAEGKRWSDFNPEQQAVFIDVAFHLGVNFTNPRSTPMVFRGIDYTSHLIEALELIREGEGTP